MKNYLRVERSKPGKSFILQLFLDRETVHPGGKFIWELYTGNGTKWTGRIQRGRGIGFHEVGSLFYWYGIRRPFSEEMKCWDHIPNGETRYYEVTATDARTFLIDPKKCFLTLEELNE